MKLIFLITFFFTSALSGQPEQQPVPFLLGSMSVCASAPAQACPPSHVTYSLIIQQVGNPQVIAYFYTITATLASSGEVRTLSGAIGRADDVAGNTLVSLDFGEAINQGYLITVQDLGALSIRVRETRGE